MTNLFKEMERNTQRFLLYVFPLAVILVIISGVLMVEDYRTSYAGYLMMPTLKVDNYFVPIAVAAIPQLGQIVMFFLFARDTRNRWALIISAILFLFDIGTDVTYKSGGNWSLAPVATFESLAIFTLGSEIMFSMMAGFVLETWPEFMIEVKRLLSTVGDGFAYLIGGSERDRR
jgi:hypothetical protein